ncbi:hypothetical protein MMC18_006102 [Xylographa bjoerkii]|nr:hypothetical protein [Xylographa bjoerkii]
MQFSFKAILTTFAGLSHLALAIPVDSIATGNETSLTSGPGGGPVTSEWVLVCGSASTEDYCQGAPYYYHCDGGMINHDQYALTCWYHCVCGEISESHVAPAIPAEDTATGHETSLTVRSGSVENMASGNETSLTSGPGGGPGLHTTIVATAARSSMISSSLSAGMTAGVRKSLLTTSPFLLPSIITEVSLSPTNPVPTSMCHGDGTGVFRCGHTLVTVPQVVGSKRPHMLPFIVLCRWPPALKAHCVPLQPDPQAAKQNCRYCFEDELADAMAYWRDTGRTDYWKHFPRWDWEGVETGSVFAEGTPQRWLETGEFVYGRKRFVRDEEGRRAGNLV